MQDLMNRQEFEDAYATVTASITKLVKRLHGISKNYSNPKLLASIYVALASGAIKDTYFCRNKEDYWDKSIDFDDIIEMYLDDFEEKLVVLKDNPELEIVKIEDN